MRVVAAGILGQGSPCLDRDLAIGFGREAEDHLTGVDGGLMHLDRDDRGLSGDVIVINGKEIVNPLNQEVVTIRGIEPGEFTINLQYYETKNGDAVEATISVIKVNPRADVVYYGQVQLARKGDEATAVRFTVLPDGQVTNVNTLPKKLVSNP